MPGGRPAKYASDEERRAADAERKRRARDVDPELPERSVDEEEPEAVADMVEFEGKLYPRAHNCSWTEEQYVAEMVKEAGIYADSIGETDAPYQLWPDVVLTNRKSERLRRAERYAHWRYQGFIAGEIASL